MEQELWDTFAELPPEAQRQVIDFIAHLKSQHAKEGEKKKTKTNLTDEPFIGMWEDREDIEDSSKWVRSIRGKVTLKCSIVRRRPDNASKGL